jgi:eukaryotic-like serine/threonine-protein kinase
MICAACNTTNAEEADACFTCGKALYVLTQGMLLAGRYEIRSALGTGGMGRVYRGRDRVLDEEVAIKVLRFEASRAPDMARRFLSEIKLARRVSHPNVCRIHEYGEHQGLRFISMEYIDGLTLKEFLRGGFLSREAAFDVAIQAAQGLQAVHDMGVIHRDFKASNIMIDSRGVARLVDFGIAKHAERDATTTTGPVFGTPEYMSPEQVRGDKLDFRSDIYALGCVVYEIFAGQAPFRGENAMDTVMKQLHEPLPLDTPAARRIPASLIPVLRKALAKAPADRYAQVADMNADLKAARQAEGLAEPSLRPLAVAAVGPALRPATHVPAVAGPAVAVPPPPVSPARRPLVWVGLAALVLGVVTWVTLNGRTGPGGALPSPQPAPPQPSREAPPPAVARAARPSPSPRVAIRPPSPVAAPPWTVATPPPTAPRVGVSGLAVETGTLRLVLVPEAEVVLDGASLGKVSARELALEAGPHTVRVLHPDFEPLQRKVNLRKGATTLLRLELAEKAIRRQR